MQIIELPSPIEFEWDTANTYKNPKKHGVSNIETEEIFSSINIILPDEKHSFREPRYSMFGKTREQKLLCTIFTLRGNKVRVISSRKANTRERIWYEAKIKKITSV